MRTELEELLEQRRLINARIRQIQAENITVGRAKIGVERYPTNKPDRWYVAIKIQQQYPDKKESWRSIISGDTRADVASKIPDVIRDLQRLYDSETQKEQLQ